MSETDDRRAIVGYFSSIGLGNTVLPGALWAQMQQHQAPEITNEMIASAEKISGLHFSDEEREEIVHGLQQLRGNIAELRRVPLDPSVVPALVFDPVPPGRKLASKTSAPMVRARVSLMSRPTSLEELAFASVTQLSELVSSRTVKPSELTDMYLSRLKRCDPQLHCVINLTEKRARQQAKDADAEISQGRYRGPLHGIPWGAKDLIAVRGYPTTWGASLYEQQQFDYDATVVTRLDEAGAILIAKLTLGSLAEGDRWWKERTRNPWNPADANRGSGGSSAGPASATAAGCVGFSIGSETNGSIVSPSALCGLSGFRPTFGRVPRTGVLAVSWTMDKLGPMCRSAEDCALVFDAIHGPDGFDNSVKSYPFNWNASAALSQLRIGYVKSKFEGTRKDGTPFKNADALNVLSVLEAQGATLIPMEMPTNLPGYLARLTLVAEAGAAFEADTLSGRIKELEPYSTCPSFFRAAQFEAAVDYVNAQRARTKLCQQYWDLFAEYDVILTPQENTSVSNVTGTPAIVIPTGFRVPRPSQNLPPITVPMPRSMCVMGPIYQDENVLAVAHAFQSATDFHTRRPPGFS